MHARTREESLMTGVASLTGMRLGRELMRHASSDVTPVVDAYEHALFAQNPRDEYAPGNEILLFVYSITPPLMYSWLLKLLLSTEIIAPWPKVARGDKS